VICGPNGVSDFDRMRAVFGRNGSPDVFLYAFDVLELDGRDLRAQRWDERRSLLTQLLDRCHDGPRLSEHVADRPLPRMDQDQEPRASLVRACGAHRLEQTRQFEITVTKDPEKSGGSGRASSLRLWHGRGESAVCGVKRPAWSRRWVGRN
jgi:hypothetical protein